MEVRVKSEGGGEAPGLKAGMVSYGCSSPSRPNASFGDGEMRGSRDPVLMGGRGGGVEEALWDNWEMAYIGFWWLRSFPVSESVEYFGSVPLAFRRTVLGPM